MSGVAITTSKSNQPSLIFATRSSSPTKSAPAALLLQLFAPRANTNYASCFTSSVWQYHCTTVCWSAFFTSIFRVVSNFYSCVKFCKVSFFCKSYSFFYAVDFCAVDFSKSSTKLLAFLAILSFSL